MNLYVYGIVPGDTNFEDERGIRDEEVFVITEGSLGAICSRIDHQSLTPNEEDLWAHERVLEHVMERGPVLPARFGSVLLDRSHVAGILSERAHVFEQQLSKLDGKVEVGIRALRPYDHDQGSEEPSDGRSYMLNKLAQQKAEEAETKRAQELWEKVHAFVEGTFADHSVKLIPNRSVAFSATYLVDAGTADDFVDRIDEDQLPDDVELFFTGPWPPYSFVDDGELVR
jgi:hypothetical protein